MKYGKLFSALSIPVAILVVWQVLSRAGVLSPLLFPAPTEVLATGLSMLSSGELMRQVGATLRRLLMGALVGGVPGLACGLLMGAFRPVRDHLKPIVSALNSTPKMALLPMLMLFAGVGEVSRVIAIAITCFIVLALHSLDAVLGVDPAHVELARNYGAGRFAMLRRVYLPASLPTIFTAMRLALGRALVLTISIEMLSAPDGIGSTLWIAWQTFSTDKLYVGVIVAATLGALCHSGLEWLEGHLILWRGHAETVQCRN
jgi:NitT/TauT family transport system permease protein